jgi:hypothetical protein
MALRGYGIYGHLLKSGFILREEALNGKGSSQPLLSNS